MPIFKQMPFFDELFIYPNKPIAQFRLNLYRMETAADIFHKGLFKHLCTHGYHQSLADPCLFIQHTPEGPLFKGIAIDDFLVQGLKKRQIANEGNIFRKKFAVQDLGDPAILIDWNIIGDGPNAIHISQLNLIKKAITRASLIHAQCWSTPLAKHTDFDDDCQAPSLSSEDRLLF